MRSCSLQRRESLSGIKVSDTTILGRITSGVKPINLDENVTVASIAKVREDKSSMGDVMTLSF